MEEKKGKKKIKKFFILIAIIIAFLIVSAIYFINNQNSAKNQQTVILENPMKVIVEKNIGKQGSTTETIIQEGVKEFDEKYIVYILLALGVDNLHSFPGFGNPIVELVLDNEVWSSEISGGSLMTRKNPNENKDLRFVLSKEEAVKALLSQDIKQFMKDSVVNGRTQIEMIAGKPELLSKGYLDLYNEFS